MADEREVELLAALPGTGRLIASAVLTSARRPGAKGTLPHRQVMVRGHAQDPARLAAYARVCGFTLRDQVPPTWLHVLTFPLQLKLMAGRDFPFPMAGMVHVANTMTLRRPVGVGEPLTLSSRAESMRPHRKGVTVDLVGEALVDEEPVWRGVSSYLVRGARLPGVDPAQEEPRPSELAPPLRLIAQWRLPADLGRRYAQVSGDLNPIHLNVLAAKAMGFPRAIAHGMWTHARALAALEGRLPAAYQVGVEFHRPILLPSTVSFAAARDERGWRVAVTGKDGERQHLTGQLT